MNSALTWVLIKVPSLVFLILPMACPSLLNITNGIRHLNQIRLDLSFTQHTPVNFHVTLPPGPTLLITSSPTQPICLAPATPASLRILGHTSSLLCSHISLEHPSPSDMYMTRKLTSQIFTQMSPSLEAFTDCMPVSQWDRLHHNWVTCPLPITVIQRPRLMEQPLSQVVPVDRPDGKGRH